MLVTEVRIKDVNVLVFTCLSTALGMNTPFHRYVRKGVCVEMLCKLHRNIDSKTLLLNYTQPQLKCAKSILGPF